MARRKKGEVAAAPVENEQAVENNDATETVIVNDEPEVEQPEPDVREPLVLATGDGMVAIDDLIDAHREYARPGDFLIDGLTLVRLDGPDLKPVVVLNSIDDEYGPPADHTEVFGRSLESIERTVLDAKFETGSLLADATALAVEMFKHRPKLWSEMSQLEQRDLIMTAERTMKTLIRKLTRVVVEGDEISVTAKLERYTHGGSTFDLKLVAQADEDAATELFKMQGHDVVIMSTDAERFLHTPASDTSEPDQPGLDLEFDPEPETPEHPQDDSDLADYGEAAAEELDDEQLIAEGAVVIGDDVELPEGGDVTATGEDGEHLHVDVVVSPPGEFEEASEDELAAQPLRSERAEAEEQASAEDDADYVGPQEPTGAAPGESWRDTGDKKLRFLHPNGSWYLDPPTLTVG